MFNALCRTFDLLYKIINTLPVVYSLPYEVILFLCCLHHSPFRIFWIDELVQNNCKVVAHELQIQDVKLASVNFVQISLKHSKTDQLGEGIVISLFITSQPICPVES